MLSSTTSAVSRRPSGPDAAPVRDVPAVVVDLRDRRPPQPVRSDDGLRITGELLAALTGRAPQD